MVRFKVNKTKIYLSIYLFCLLFAPPIVPRINFLYLLTLFTLFVMVKNNKLHYFRILRTRPIFKFYFRYMWIIMWVLLAMLFSLILYPINIDNYMIVLYKFFMILFPVTICCVYFVGCTIKEKYTLENVLEIIIYAGLIQAFFAVVMLLFPPVKSFFVEIILKNSSNQALSDISSWEYSRRYFAFSDAMVDILGYGVGIIAAIPLFMNLVKKNKLFNVIPILAVVPFLNAVTGVVFFIIGVFIYFIANLSHFSKRRIRNMLYLLLFGVVGIVAVFIFARFAFDWVMRELFAFITPKGDEITSFSKIFSTSFWYFPNNIINLLFGSGHTVYGAVGFAHSDIGVINNIWLIGIFGTTCLYFNYISLFYTSIKKAIKEYKYLLLFLLICFLVFEIKGVGISYHPGYPLLYIICFFILTNNGCEHEKL